MALLQQLLAKTRQNPMLLGYLAALGAAISYGVVSLVARKIVTDYSSPMVGTAFSMMFGTIIVAGLFHRDAMTDAATAPRKAWVYVALAGCASTWGVSFWFLAFNEAPVVLVAPAAGTHPLIAILLSHIFLQRLERVTLRTMLGAVFVVGGVAMVAVGANS